MDFTVEEMTENAHKCGIPEHMIDGLMRYIEHGIPPGSFLRTVVGNDLMETLGRADDDNRNALPAYGKFLYNYAPSSCFRSPEHVADWIACGGVRGILAKLTA